MVGEQDGEDGGADPAGVPRGQVDLAEEEDEDEAHGDGDAARALGQQVGEVQLGQEDRAQGGEEHAQDDQAEYGGEGAQLAAPYPIDVVPGDRAQTRGSGRSVLLRRTGTAWQFRLLGGDCGGHAVTPLLWARPRSPLRPEVMSSTTWEYVTSDVLTWAAIRPR